MTERFEPDRALLASVRRRLSARRRLRFLVGGAGSGKTTVARCIADQRPALRVLDMDARLYGSWGDRWSAVRHPAAMAWLTSGDALAFQMAMLPDTFLAFQATLAVEALDLLADEIEAEPDEWILVDGGFGSVGALAEAVPPAWIACLAQDGLAPAEVWRAQPDRKAFLDMVASIAAVEEPAVRFLALDAAMNARMRAEANALGVAVVARDASESIATTAGRVIAVLGLDSD